MERSEPRIVSHIIAGAYKLLDFKARLQHLRGALKGADAAAELFLKNGIDRWEKQEKITPSEAAGLRTRLSSDSARYATRHLGVHLVMSVAIAIPIPGIRSAARFLWTLTFWGKSQLSRLRRGRVSDTDQIANIHTPLVMVLALVPEQAFGPANGRPNCLEPSVQAIPKDGNWPLVGSAG